MGTNRQFLLSVIALFVVTLMFGFLVHGLLLESSYARLPNVMRSIEESGNHFHWMLLAHLSIAIGLTWIYRQGRSNRPWFGQGIRFGLAVAVLTTIPTYLIYHAVAQFPFDLAVLQILYDGAAIVVTGIVTAALNR